MTRDERRHRETAIGPRRRPSADDPACTRIAEDYPDRIAGLDRTDTSTEGAAVWGDGAVIAHCGFPMPDPTVDPCAQVDGVDWVWREDQDHDGRKLLITYGREPAVEVQVSVDQAAPDAVIVSLSRVVKTIRQSKKCISLADVPSPPSPMPDNHPHS